MITSPLLISTNVWLNTSRSYIANNQVCGSQLCWSLGKQLLQGGVCLGTRTEGKTSQCKVAHHRCIMKVPSHSPGHGGF